MFQSKCNLHEMFIRSPTGIQLFSSHLLAYQKQMSQEGTCFENVHQYHLGAHEFMFISTFEDSMLLLVEMFYPQNKIKNNCERKRK